MKIRNLWWTKIQLMKHRSCQNKPGVKEENNEDDGIPEQEKRNRPSLKKWIPEKGNSINISPTKNATIPVRQTNGKPSKHTTNSGIKRRGKTSKRVKGKEKTDSKCILEKKKATNATQKARGKRMRNAKISEDENGKGCKDKVLIFSKNRNSIKSGQRARGKANKNSAKSGNKNKERVSIKGKAQNIPDSKDVTDSGQQTSVAPRNADRKPGLRGGVRGVEQIVRITETNAGHSKKGEPYYPGQNEGNLATPGERSPRKDSA
ncbi:uncharacterized protein LOC130052728 [Ostrea edulis]|uniref:uncharacterized protein LOC130052728 n=1 Tax=Ostrea edulis TaxID=37623 RepID=UPI0024AE8A8E|nr:uncharacterized protein LOC130052728 [Ostrea edulis]